jgi:hypothetical protein
MKALRARLLQQSNEKVKKTEHYKSGKTDSSEKIIDLGSRIGKFLDIEPLELVQSLSKNLDLPRKLQGNNYH